MRPRFTLVELMIVVAIIGILAAIALPNFAAMQLRAKRAEAAPNAESIRDAEFAHLAVTDVFAGVSTTNPREQVDLDGSAAAWRTGTDFDTLGWAPDGNVRCTYYINADNVSVPVAAGVAAYCDIDNDGLIFVHELSLIGDDAVSLATNLEEY